MLDLSTGVFREMDPDSAGVLRRIFAAGANFRVLRFGGRLLVLETIPADVTIATS